MCVQLPAEYTSKILTLLCNGIRKANNANPTSAEGPICRIKSIAQTIICIGAVLYSQYCSIRNVQA